MEMVINSLSTYLNAKKSNSPLIIFRMVFGALMAFSILRFMAKGWVQSMYVEPKMHFPYFGFEWVRVLPEEGMTVVFGLLFLSSIGILLGALYRLSTIVFFVLFVYVELIDKTNYLNHYYFISLISFLLMFIPAGNRFSLDNKWFHREEVTHAPRLFLTLLQLQMFVVYFFAGVAKLNFEWLFEAQPLKIWLPAYSHYPLIGNFLEKEWIAYVFCWFACLYDLLIGFFLFHRRTVNWAYFFVVVFHLATSLFFNIGMFPFIMIAITTVFFKTEFHTKLLERAERLTQYKKKENPLTTSITSDIKALKVFFVIYFLIQFMLPFRYLIYPGKLFWTEQGYRFSWRVMLIEKAGIAFFSVHDKRSQRSCEVDNSEYLTAMQEKMMATQPDMMVDYAKFLNKEYSRLGFTDPEVRVKSFVTLNGVGTREFIDPSIDLSKESNSFLKNKTWIRSY